MKLTRTHQRVMLATPLPVTSMVPPTSTPRRLCVALAYAYGRCLLELVTIAHRFGTLRRQRLKEPRQ